MGRDCNGTLSRVDLPEEEKESVREIGGIRASMKFYLGRHVRARYIANGNLPLRYMV